MKSYILVRHSVVYFPSWKSVFDENQKNARKYGIASLHVMRDNTTPNDMTLLFEVADIEKAKEFMASDILKRAMQKAGVHCKPEISYLVDGIEHAGQ